MVGPVVTRGLVLKWLEKQGGIQSLKAYIDASIGQLSDAVRIGEARQQHRT